MPSKNFDVLARLRLAGASEMQRQLRAVGMHARNAASHMRQFASPFRGIGGVLGIGGLAAAGLGVRRLASDLIKMPVAAEQAKLSLATVIQSSFNVKDYNEAYQAAGALRERLKDIAAQSPGDLPDYMEAVRDIGVMARGTGASLEDLAQMARVVVSTQKVSGFSAGIVGRDIRQILQGRGGAQQIQTPALIPESLKIAALAKSGKKLEAWPRIQKAMAQGVSKEAMDRYGQSWEAQLDTLKMEYRTFMEMAGQPVLAHLSVWLRDANAWLSANRDKVAEFAKIVGQKAVAAAKWLGNAVRWIAAHWDGILSAVKTFAVVWLAGKALQSAYHLGAAFRDVYRTLRELGPALRGGLLGGIGAAIGLLGVLYAKAEAAVERMRGGKAVAQSETARLAAEVAAAEKRGDAAAAATYRDQGRALMAAQAVATQQAAFIKRFEESGATNLFERAGNALQFMQKFSTGGDIKSITPAEMRRRFEAAVDRAHDEARRKEAASAAQAKAELERIMASAANSGRPINVDARGSRIQVNQDFRQADPDAVFFAFTQGVARGIVRNASEFAPRMN